MKITDGLIKLTLDQMVGKLHNAIVQFAKDMKDVVEENKALSFGDIQELRLNIQQRLNRNEELKDNQRLLKMLDLFATDKAVLDIIREDADGWVELLEAIEDNIKSRAGGNLTADEKAEIKKIGELTTEIKELLRKD